MWCKFGKGRNSEYICLWFVIIDLFQLLSFFFFFIRKIFILGHSSKRRDHSMKMAKI